MFDRKLTTFPPLKRPKSLVQSYKFFSTNKFAGLEQEERIEKVFSIKASNNRNNQKLANFRHQISELLDDISQPYSDKSLPKMNGITFLQISHNTLKSMTLSPTAYSTSSNQRNWPSSF